MLKVPFITCYHFLDRYMNSFDFSGNRVERKHDMLVTRSGDYRPTGSGRGNHYSADNGLFYLQSLEPELIMYSFNQLVP